MGLPSPTSPLGVLAPAPQAGDAEYAVHSSLSEPRWQGALLIGPPGIGKTRTLDAAIDHFTGTFHIERLLCTEHLAQQPYGSLQLLVTELEEPLTADPLSAFPIVARALRRRAAERPVLLVMDNCDRTDELSASQLREALAERGIEWRPVWKPMHLQPVFQNPERYPRKVTGMAEHLFSHGLVLPSGPAMSAAERGEVEVCLYEASRAGLGAPALSSAGMNSAGMSSAGSGGTGCRGGGAGSAGSSGAGGTS